MSGIRVLVVDDEPDMLENCQRLLSRGGYEVRTLSRPTAVRAVHGEFHPDVALIDLRMPDADGMTVLAVLVAEDPALPVIIMTAFATVASAVQTIREGAFDYVTKPFTGAQLLSAVERAAQYRGLVPGRTRRVGGADSGEILGTSPRVARLLEEIHRVAPTDANVLVSGESGTGKELVARCLHASGARREGPFVPIDCASLSEPLLESELFGHERGAFTGAVNRKPGLLVEAAGGTVFLDEVGELTPALQSKLLRVLEERRVHPVGSTVFIPIDVRIVAATNIDLAAAATAGRFRHDLFYRLNVVHLHVPALRTRPGDIPVLLLAFLERFAAELKRRAPAVSPEAWTALQAHPWPGNVRELRNLAQRLVVLDRDGRITLADLPDAIRGWADQDADTSGPPPSYTEAREEALTEFRRGYVRRLLELHGGNVTRAAMAAGVSRRTLHRWLAEDGRPVPDEPEVHRW
ncbi:MAG TPA: sigma-54 dependent transcriptional regulator [Gemmatimonadales bacterium]|nr:sigma-54 dependent transcriptional regulator [Gemmatimonadales bacterium]